MPVPVARVLRRLTLLLLVAIVAAIPAAADDAAIAARAAQLKQMQVRFMMREARARLMEHIARRRAARKSARDRDRVGEKARPERLEPADPAPAGALGVSRLPSPAAALSIATNRLVNDRAGDAANSGQCEVSIAASGLHVVAAWNDGQGFVTSSSTQGFAYSSDGGVTWTDGGTAPITNVGTWTSDPVVAVNEKTGAFYFSALCEPTANVTNGVGVVKGTFVGSVLTWGTPELAISGNYSSVIYDKEWLAADSTSSNLYLAYSRFSVAGGNITSNRIDFQRKVGVAAFSAPIQISAVADNGLVQGVRLAIGPGGEVWATWNAIGSVDVDFMRVRRAPVGGSPFGSEFTAVSQYTNYGTGAPGFNRGMGFAFPGLAIDRSNGPHRGRAYMIWNESLNFFNDALGNAGTVAEVESNNTPATGTPFTMGQHLTGSMSSISDFDYWRFSGIAGQTIICQADANVDPSPTLDAAFRLFCTDATTRLAYSETGVGQSGLIVFTLPVTGTYTLRVAAISGSGSYTIDTGLNGLITERARDHRDVFTSYSDNVSTWSTPARVNGEPAGLDDWLPEVAVASDGNVYASWYDWRDAPPSVCGGASMMYLSRSTDYTTTWPDGSPVSDATTLWSSVASNIAPNEGDYTSLYANQNNVYVCWSDGRSGDPDVYMAAPILNFTPVLVSVANTHVEPGLVRITWYAADASSFSATVYRRTDDGEWTSFGQVSPNGDGELVFEDHAVAAGTTYHYRLGVIEGGQESFLGEVAVTVPATPALALAIETVRPNPADREMWVSFSLPVSEPATLELIDVSGRRVREQTVTGTGRQTIDLAAGPRLAPGLYLIRLTQAGQSTVKRVSVVR